MGSDRPDDDPDAFPWFDRMAMAILRRFRWLPRNSAVVAMFALVFLPVPLLSIMKAIGLPRAVAGPLVLMSALLAIAISVTVLRTLTITRRYNEAFEHDDFEAIARLNRLMEGAGLPRTPFDRANRLIGQAELFARFERWAEARDTFAKIDRSALVESARPGILGQHALATAHGGQPELALEMAERALEEAEAQETYPEDKMWFVRARLGIVLSLAGRHEAANDVLLEALVTEGGDPRTWTAVQFFQASSLHARGNLDDAAMHLDDSRHGEGPYVARAKEALDHLRAAPLRVGTLPESRAVDDDIAEEDEATEETHGTARSLHPRDHG